jgi:hypothetical protein
LNIDLISLHIRLGQRYKIDLQVQSCTCFSQLKKLRLILTENFTCQLWPGMFSFELKINLDFLLRKTGASLNFKIEL